MQSNLVPTCCGARILTHFGGKIGTTSANTENYTSDQVRVFLKDQEEANRVNNNPLLLAILNNTQNEKYGHVFKELGWELKAEAYHPKHYSTLFHYTKIIPFVKSTTIYRQSF